MTVFSKTLVALTAVAVLGTSIPLLAQEHAERRGERHAHADMGKGMKGKHRDGERRGERMQNFMEMFDTNADGAITQDEIDATRNERLAAFDANADGNLSLEEFEALWLDAMRERMVDQFQRHDANGDGLVTADEFNKRFSGLVARMDRNDDGVLNADDQRRPRRAPPAE